MKVSIDPDLCTGCELCVDTCPDVFEMDEDIAKVIVDEVPAGLEDDAQEAIDSCPSEAISAS
jgi:ferredoxin